jgi:hypothetical protein
LEVEKEGTGKGEEVGDNGASVDSGGLIEEAWWWIKGWATDPRLLKKKQNLWFRGGATAAEISSDIWVKACLLYSPKCIRLIS